MRAPTKTLWQLLCPTDKPGYKPAHAYFFSDGATALAAFAKSDPGSILQPVAFRVDAKSKELALKGESYYVTVSPATIVSMVMPTADDDVERFQKIGKTIDEFVKAMARS